jgi:H+/Cl- antiporter ClcA
MVNKYHPFSIAPSLQFFTARIQSFSKKSINKRVLYLSFQAILNAIIIGILAKSLVLLIDLLTNLSFYGKFSFQPVSPAGNTLGSWVILVPVAGALIVGLIARYGSKAIRGHGIPEAMEKIISSESKIPPSLTILKPVSAAISIGTGGPFGAEGPIIATGGAFGSWIGQMIHISSRERKTILAAGATAGMATIFGTPMAAILLALELLLFEFSPKSIIPVALACITGASMHLLLFESGTVFHSAHIEAATLSSIWIYILLGAIIGIASVLISKLIYWIEDQFERLPIHWMWWPAIGALAVGIAGYFTPNTLGVGYENIHGMLTGEFTPAFLISLFIFKLISWSISLGSGTSGGTLAPLLTIGGALGALLGLLAIKIFPSAGISIVTCSLVGMAALFAGASRAVFTSVVFAIETTGQFNGLYPVLAGCTMAYLISMLLMKTSIMSEKINRRGILTPDTYEPDLLQYAPVIAARINEDNHSVSETIGEKETIGSAINKMIKKKTDRLAILSEKNNSEILGLISKESIIDFYHLSKRKDISYQSPNKTKRIIVFWRKKLKIH